MMGTTHRLFGGFCGVAAATLTGEPWYTVAATGLIATSTAFGGSSPDMDQDDWFVRLRRSLPRPVAKKMCHRGLTHWPELLFFAWLAINVGLPGWVPVLPELPALIPAGDRWVYNAFLIGWGSHILGDAIFGVIPVGFGKKYVGLDVADTGGLLEDGVWNGRKVLPFSPTKVAIIIATAVILILSPGMPTLPAWDTLPEIGTNLYERLQQLDA